PTLSALKARRLEATRGAITTRIAAGDRDETRARVQTLGADFDIADIAAAAVALLQAASDTPAGNQPDQEPPRAARPDYDDSRRAPRRFDGDDRRPPRRDDRGDAPRAPRQDGDYERRPAAARAPRPDRPFAPRETRAPRAPRVQTPLAGAVVLSFSVGRTQGVRPGDLVGAITGEAGITSRELGAITILPHSSLVEVAGDAAAQVMKAMKGASIRGEQFTVKVAKPPRE
ncbi:MAG: DbpA RNA binding domain-containing protein, partial [Acidobacteria bacterium]|nr:DbpA RNA binding domain-containing protein [Acidobacteriota bacterium]